MGMTIEVFKRVGYISEEKEISLITSLQKFKTLGELEADFFDNLMLLTSVHVLFIEIDFCRSGLIHGFSINLSLYLLTFVEVAHILIKSFYESKKFVKSG